MLASTRRKSIIFFISLSALLIALAVALNVGWILLNWREVALLVFGAVFFIAIIAGMVLNTIFLVREIRRNEQHDSFINAVTHELKTPIASIRLYLETLQTRDVHPDKRQEFYGIMLADTDRLLTTVEQVLRAGQMGQRRRHLNLAPIDIGLLAKECIELARTRFRLKDDALVYREELNNGHRPIVQGDRDELRAALSNLIDNAIKYSVQEIQVSVAVVEEGKGQVAIKVQDHGIGIPPAQLKRIFKRFYRVPGQMMARIKGTGLGLFIVQSIVERHGGKVRAESEGEGKGSIFTIQLSKAS
ncbi:MAG: sensor histidine kinase [Acidobacteria bacterium]|nr:sensor histidine kinase [Acidobacteriota bacterium]